MLNSKRVLFFLNGFLLATMLYFYLEDSYEKSLFETMALYVLEHQPPNPSEEDVLLSSLHLINTLEMNRNEIFGNPNFYSAKSSLFHPITYDLMTANGACGSYTYILSRLLCELHITNRIAQMVVNGNYGGHIILEAQTSKGWVVLDPLYTLSFIKPDSTLASFNDVHNDWNYYKKQVPSNYDTTYRYEAARYTNWEKIPVVMPLIKNILTLAWGKERTELFSLRVLMLRQFHILFIITATLYILLLLSIIRKYIKIPTTSITDFLSFGDYKKLMNRSTSEKIG